MIKFYTKRQSGTVSLVCLNCGYMYKDLSKFYLKHLVDMKCSVCGANTWRNAKNCTDQQRDNSLWKKLLVVQHKEKFVPGKWKLNRRYRKFYDSVEDLSPKARKALKAYAGDNPVPEGMEDETE